MIGYPDWWGFELALVSLSLRIGLTPASSHPRIPSPSNSNLHLPPESTRHPRLRRTRGNEGIGAIRRCAEQVHRDRVRLPPWFYRRRLADTVESGGTCLNRRRRAEGWSVVATW